jgi:hypothetical protein
MTIDHARHKEAPQWIVDAKRMLDAGLAVNLIAEFVGHNQGAVWKALHRRGWWNRPKREHCEACFYKGVRYSLTAKGYYRASNGRGSRGGGYLHQVIYVEHFGPVPEGHEVHHKDHDKANNAPQNLEAVPVLWHSDHHNPTGVRRGAAAMGVCQ